MLLAGELYKSHAHRATLFLTLTLFFCAASARAQNASFTGRDYPIVGNNHAAADLNGDGRADIAGAGATGIRVILNNGDGTFGAAVEYPTAARTQDIAAGDLNGDGRLDLVATNLDQQTGLSVLLGNGDGTFGAAASYANDTGDDAPSIILADIDHDSRLDAVVAHQLHCFTSPCVVANSISLWRGLGDGTFQPPQQITVGPGLYELAPADLNNDGHIDLAVAAMSGKVFVLLGNGDGTFRQLPDLTLVANVDNTDIDAADFNGDQIQDLVVAADADHRTIILLGNGDGTFRLSVSVPDALQERPGQQTVADFNGDTFQDVAIGMAFCCSVNTSDGALGILFGNGNGTFKPVVRYLIPGAAIANAGGVTDASDFNGDGRKDILLQIRGNNPGTTVLLNTTGAAAPTSSTIGGVQFAPSSVVGSLTTEANVTLSPGTVAPSGGVPLTISSSNTSVATVPSGVRIVAGMTNVRFKINTSRVTSTRTVTITVGTGRGSSRTATLTVTPPTEPLALGSVQLQPASVFGGNSTTGIVNLTTGNVAPAGGAIVSITNDNPALVTTPANVTIPAGQLSASFPIQTQPTGLTTPVQITGSYGGASRSATLTVSAPSNAAALISATLTPSTVVGGSAQGVRIQVTLDQPAPPEGATVSLSSDTPSVVNLPASLSIQSGGTGGFADFSTTAVSTPRQVTIRATFGSSTQSAVLNVTPPSAPAVTLSALTLNPTTVTGGASAQGTVSLSAPAQSATVVSLSASSALASVPASITIAAGSTSATFSVGTTSVASSATVTVTATSGGVTRSATLTVNPAATNADTVSVQKAEYDSSKRTLKVEASSSSSNATLQVFVTSTGQLLGTLSSNGGGKFSGQLSPSTNPQNITVRSSLGGSATRAVAAK